MIMWWMMLSVLFTNRAAIQMIYAELTEPLFHGSTLQIREIDISMGAARKDFGRGFYTTTSHFQAEKFASLKAFRGNVKDGFVSVFEYIHKPELKIKKFSNANTEWLSFVLKNRSFSEEKIPPFGKAEFDIIIGPVANDAVGLVLNQLLIGTYGDPHSSEAKDTAIRLLDTAKLYNQVFFGTNRAVSCLKFREAYKVGINRNADRRGD
jgi:hypothetical protein